jgi:hypothetical protein
MSAKTGIDIFQGILYNKALTLKQRQNVNKTAKCHPKEKLAKELQRG